jgi:hypothetical protein
MLPRISTHQRAKLENHKAFDTKKFSEIQELMTQYNQLQTKKQIIQEGNAPKKLKKEMLLEKSKDSVLSRLEGAELEQINAESHADTVFNNLVSQLEEKKSRAIELAKANYDKLVDAAERAYQHSYSFASNQHQQMVDKSKRTYEVKKRQLELRGESVKDELQYITECKSAPEITIKNQEQKLLQEMETIIKGMQMGRAGEPDWYLAELSPIPTLPGEILKKPTSTLLHMPNIPYQSPEELELEALRKVELTKVAIRERNEEAEKQRKKQEQEEKYQASLEKTKAMDEENKRRLAIALELASKKQEEEEEEDHDDWSEEAISKFCTTTKTIVIDDKPNSPKSEEILQDLIKSINTPA